jgi:hypothetical protein
MSRPGIVETACFLAEHGAMTSLRGRHEAHVG